MKRILSASLLLCAVVCAMAQNINSVSGYVMCSESGPLEGCLVTEVDSHGRTVNSCYTNEGGVFVLPIRNSKKNEIQVVREGYKTTRVVINSRMMKIFINPVDKEDLAAVGVAVDLGLSVKWSDRNVGAKSPTETGNFYSWGETFVKDNYYWTDADTGLMEISDSDYDVAHVLWKKRWVMPTQTEIDELINRCVWKWGECDGVSGFTVTGPSGKSIFLPAGGYRSHFDLLEEGVQGNYWSSTRFLDKQDNSDALEIRASRIYHGIRHRGTGMNIRPVWR